MITYFLYNPVSFYEYEYSVFVPHKVQASWVCEILCKLPLVSFS